MCCHVMCVSHIVFCFASGGALLHFPADKGPFVPGFVPTEEESPLGPRYLFKTPGGSTDTLKDTQASLQAVASAQVLHALPSTLGTPPPSTPSPTTVASPASLARTSMPSTPSATCPTEVPSVPSASQATPNPQQDSTTKPAPKQPAAVQPETATKPQSLEQPGAVQPETATKPPSPKQPGAVQPKTATKPPSPKQPGAVAVQQETPDQVATPRKHQVAPEKEGVKCSGIPTTRKKHTSPKSKTTPEKQGSGAGSSRDRPAGLAEPGDGFEAHLGWECARGEVEEHVPGWILLEDCAFLCDMTWHDSLQSPCLCVVVFMLHLETMLYERLHILSISILIIVCLYHLMLAIGAYWWYHAVCWLELTCVGVG